MTPTNNPPNTLRRFVIWTAVSTKVQSAEERLSLPIQERDGMAFAEAHGGVVVDILRVPGHSRRFKDLRLLSIAAAKKGIDAFIRLEQHWTNRDVDVVWVRGGDRFARTQSLHARITEELIDAGIVIFSQEDGGWIDKSNYRMWTAFNGLTAATQVDKLVNEGQKTKDSKALAGSLRVSRPVWSHREILDSRGRFIGYEPDPDKQLIVEDAARLVIEGVGWFNMEREIASRFGHSNNGKPFSATFFYQLFFNPSFYGNTARRWNSTHSKTSRKKGVWVFDASAEVPEGVLLQRNTHPPALTGALMDRLQAELWRRYRKRGGWRPGTSKRFTGLLICAQCGYRLTYARNEQGRSYWRCPSVFINGVRPKCPKLRHIPEPLVMEWFDAGLRIALETRDIAYFRPPTQEDSPHREVDLLTKRLSTLKAEARQLIAKQRQADPMFAALYDEQLQAIAAELRPIEGRLSDATRRAQDRQSDIALQAVEDVRGYDTLERFWASEPRIINQVLHRLMGRYRVSVNDKKIVHVVEPL